MLEGLGACSRASQAGGFKLWGLGVKQGHALGPYTRSFMLKDGMGKLLHVVGLGDDASHGLEHYKRGVIGRKVDGPRAWN